jgi:tetratricopeptide (TPR) repeat protein
MLETIRAYALERLQESDEALETGNRHADYFSDLAARSEEEGRWVLTVDWTRYERELGNFRAALTWLHEHAEAERMASLVASIPWFWFGQLAEASRWCDEALRVAPEISREAQAKVQRWAAILMRWRGDLAGARSHGERAVALAREIGDPVIEADGLFALASIDGYEGDFKGAQRRAAEAAVIFRALGVQKSLLSLLHTSGLWAIQAGDYAQARAYLEEALTNARELGARDHVCNALCDLGVLALCERRLEDAVPLFAESLQLSRQAGWHGMVAWTIGGVGCALASIGSLDAAARLLGAAETLHEQFGPLEPYAVPAYEERSAPVRERIGEADAAAAWAAGRAMSEDEAAVYALAQVGANVPG